MDIAAHTDKQVDTYARIEIAENEKAYLAVRSMAASLAFRRMLVLPSRLPSCQPGVTNPEGHGKACARTILDALPSGS